MIDVSRAHQLTLDLGEMPRGARLPSARNRSRTAAGAEQFALDLLVWARFAFVCQETLVAAATRLHPVGSERKRPPAMMTFGRMEYVVREVALGASGHVVWCQMHAVPAVPLQRAAWVFGRGDSARGYGEPSGDALYIVDLDDVSAMTAAMAHATSTGFEVYA